MFIVLKAELQGFSFSGDMLVEEKHGNGQRKKTNDHLISRL